MSLLSVLLPVYNAEAFVEEAVTSVLRQTFGDFVFYIVDDGSTDNSLSILERFAVLDSRIVLRARANRGLVATLNELMELAGTEFVARMDADDICRPTRFQQQLQYLQTHPKCVAVGTRSLFIDPDGLPLYEFCDHFSNAEVNKVLLKPDIGLLHPSVMMRRAAVAEVGGYTHDFPHVEDLDLFLRLGEIGDLGNLPDVLIEYRLHSESVTHRHALAQHVAGLKAVREACRRRGIPFHREADITRPNYEFQTPLSIHKKWAWCALSARNIRAARKHALRSFLLAPMDPESVRLLACAVRGY